jgi:hypothetical protein
MANVLNSRGGFKQVQVVTQRLLHRPGAKRTQTGFGTVAAWPV